MEQSYHGVEDEDGSSTLDSLLPSQSHSQHRRTIVSFAVGALVTFLITAGMTLESFSTITSTCPDPFQETGARPSLAPLTPGIDALTQKPSSWFSGPCGRSPAEARAADCSLDLVSFSWLPRACTGEREQDDEDEFFALRTWNFTSDVQKRHRIADLRALLEGDAAPDRIYTSADWHYAHCAYMFRRLQRRFTNGQAVDGYVASEGHARHCASIIAGARETWEQEMRGALTATRVFIKYPECV